MSHALWGDDPQIKRGRGELENDEAFELNISFPAPDDDPVHALGKGKDLWHVLIVGFGAIAPPTYNSLFEIGSGRDIPDHGWGYGFRVDVEEKGVSRDIGRIDQSLQDVVARIGDLKGIYGAAAEGGVKGLQGLADG